MNEIEKILERNGRNILKTIKEAVDGIERQESGHYVSDCPVCGGLKALVVMPNKNAFYCFNSKVGGGTERFLELIAEKWVQVGESTAEKYEITRKKVCKAIDRVSQLTEGCLRNAPEVLSRLLSVGVTYKDMLEFRIGYYPGGTTNVIDIMYAAQREGSPLEDQIDAGILERSLPIEKKVYFSILEERLTVPIMVDGNTYGIRSYVFREGDMRGNRQNPTCFHPTISEFLPKGRLKEVLELINGMRYEK